MKTETAGNERVNDVPDVSVVMPAHNAGPHIEESILSVLAQTWQSLELIVIDDASTDDTREVVARIGREESRIRLLSNASNRGVSFSRNRGMQNTRGRFLMFLDSDDLWECTKVETQLAFMRANDCAVSYMDYARFRVAEEGRAWSVTAPGRIAYRDLLASNEIGMLTAAIDLSRVSRLPEFENQGHEDYLFWLDLLKGLHPQAALKAPSPRPLARYRERAGSVSSNRVRSALWHWKVLIREKQKLPSRLVLMTRYALRALGKRNVIRQAFVNLTTWNRRSDKAANPAGH